MSNINLKFGKKVPEGALNLAWITLPQLSPGKNVFISNVSETITSNTYTFYESTLSSQVTAVTYTIKSADDQSFTKPETTKHRYCYTLQVHAPIMVLPPVADETDAWRVRVTDGIMYRRFTLDARELDTDGSSWLKSAAEAAGWEAGDELVGVYTLQDASLDMCGLELYNGWGTTERYYVKTLTDVRAYPLGANRIKLPATHVRQVTSIKVNGSELMTKADQVLWTATKKVMKTKIVAQFEPVEGILTLRKPISQADEVTVTLKYRPTEYLYHGYMGATRFYDLDLNPGYGHTYDNGKSGADLTKSVVYMFLLPSAVYRLSDANLTGDVSIHRAIDYGVQHLLRWESGPAVSVPQVDTLDPTSHKLGAYGQAIYDDFLFTDRLPADFPGVTSGSSPIGTNLQAGGIGTLSDYPSALILAKIFVSGTGTIDSVKVIDTRSRGGGLGEDFESRKAMLSGAELMEADSCWDTSGWQGTPVMLNGVVVFEIPKALLDSEGGSFTERQIEEIVSRHITAGVKPVIRYI